MEGIIVKSMDYKESSKLVYIVTEEGLQTLLVKGAKQYKSKNFAYSQVLNKIQFESIPSKTFTILGSANIVASYSKIKQSFERTQAAYLVLEYAYQFAEHISEFKLFYSFLQSILESIDQKSQFILYSIIFRLKLLYLLGIGPIFSHCIQCESKENLRGFDLYNGGVKCNNCFEATDFLYATSLIQKIKYLYLVKLDQVDEEALQQCMDVVSQLDEFLSRYYDHYLGYHSRVEKIYKKIT